MMLVLDVKYFAESPLHEYGDKPRIIFNANLGANEPFFSLIQEEIHDRIRGRGYVETTSPRYNTGA